MPPVRRQISRHAAPMRRAMTPAERALWFALRDRRLAGYKFRRQATVGSCTVPDFLCIEAALIVEADGGQHDETVDAARTRYLNAQGYRVVRFWNDDILGNLPSVLETLLIVLEEQMRKKK